ncbi:FAD-dependent oxidoreductase [Raineyella fluvialis]|uniref:FAD-dependent oxidoreductase n=1 Tax=Raineyella fluvialis TaxID=2662261 RepID=A0A5Q2FB23_9ACTN|nr:FAD-dependent oxidoreductase [Raineyella fluvialis]QGF24220.1 FAD-dependent oxidoreductase [Raineyella fluvialis]
MSTRHASRPSDQDGGTVVIVGGSLAGMAAAARLAKRGHRVTLVRRTPRLAAEWRPDGPTRPGLLPEVLTLPAPWRDLFKKSGRILPAELARAGLDLVPAAPARHIFTDGEELLLGGDRGQQFHQLAATHGTAVAESWRDLVDSLEPLWHLVRTLGLETSLVSGRQVRPHRRALRWGLSVADLAAAQPHPHLRALVEAAAWRRGHDPARTPAFVAALLNVERTFGRWTVVDAEGRPAGSERLLDLLEARLAGRGVDVVDYERPIRFDSSPRRPDGRTLADEVVGAVLPAGTRPDAVVLAEGLHDLVGSYGLRTRAARRVATLTPVLRPRRSCGPAEPELPGPGITEIVDHAARRVTWASQDRTVIHDWGAATPDPEHGPAWDGPQTWLRRLPVRLGERLYSAGPWGGAATTLPRC